jgi:Tat protein translocase TatB subunit
MGIGFNEILVILAVALIVLGPTRLPGAAKTLGRAVREFRESFYGLEKSLTDEHSDDNAGRTDRTKPVDGGSTSGDEAGQDGPSAD